MKFLLISLLIITTSCYSSKSKQLFDKLNEELNNSNEMKMNNFNQNNIIKNEAPMNNENAMEGSLFDSLENNDESNINMIQKNDKKASNNSNNNEKVNNINFEMPPINIPEMSKETVSIQIGKPIADKEKSNNNKNSSNNNSINGENKKNENKAVENNKSLVNDVKAEELNNDNNNNNNNTKEVAKLKKKHISEIKQKARKSEKKEKVNKESSQIIEKNNKNSNKESKSLNNITDETKQSNEATKKEDHKKVINYIKKIDNKVENLKEDFTEEAKRLELELLNKERLISHELNKDNKAFSNILERISSLENKLKLMKNAVESHKNNRNIHLDSLVVTNNLLSKGASSFNRVEVQDSLNIGNVSINESRMKIPENLIFEINHDSENNNKNYRLESKFSISAGELFSLVTDAASISQKCEGRLYNCLFLKDELQNNNNILKNLESLKKKLKVNKY